MTSTLKTTMIDLGHLVGSTDLTTWSNALQSFATSHASAFLDPSDSSPKLNDKQKREFIGVLFGLLQSDAWSHEARASAFATVKIISRTRTGLDPMFDSSNILWMANYAASVEASAPARLEALRVLLNVLVLAREAMTELFRQIKVTPILLQVLQLTKDLKAQFTVARMLFYLTLDDAIAATVVDDCQGYNVIVQHIVAECSGSDRFAELAANTETANDRRRAMSQLIKVLFNLAQDTSRPRPETKIDKKLSEQAVRMLTAAAALGYSQKDVDAVIKASKEPLPEFVPRTDEPSKGTDSDDDEDEEGPGDMSIEEFVKLQAAKRKAKEAAKAKEKEKEKPKEAEASAGKSDGKAADKADGAGAAKSDGKADAKGEAKSDAADAKAAKGAKESAGDSKESKGDSKQTKRFVEDPDDWDPNKTTMREIRQDVSNLCIYLEKHLAPIWETNLVGIHALMHQLHHKAMTCLSGKDVPFARQLETNVTPLMISLTNIMNESDVVRQYVKRFIFGKYADKSGVTKPGDLGMMPEGAVSEKKFDADEQSLKSWLLKNMTSMSWNLKSVVNEFLWVTCKKDPNEFIRLTGFGNAVGLLSEKGLPGFAHFAQNAVNLSDLMRAAGGKRS